MERTDQKKEQDIREILRIYDALPRETQKAFCTFVELWWKAEGTEAAKRIGCFMEAVHGPRENFRAALDIMIAALRGNDTAWGVIEATLEEAGA